MFSKDVLLSALLIYSTIYIIGCAGEIETYNYAKDGSEAYNNAEYSVALDQWQAGLEQARISENKKDESMFLFNIGLAHDRLNQYQAALEYYHNALEIRRELDETHGEGNTLNNIGIIYDKLGEYEDALSYYHQALEIQQKLDDNDGESRNLNNIGAVYQHQGKYQQAQESYQQALAIRQASGDRGGEGNILNNLGTLFWIRGDYQQALDSYQQALTIRKENGDTAGEGCTLNNIGVVYWNLGLYQQALDYYQQALHIRQNLQDKRGEASNLNNIGVVYWKLNEYEQARSFYQQALDIRQAINDTRGEGATLNNIGKIYEKQTEYQLALDAYQRSLDISRNIGDKLGEANALNNLGGMYRHLKQYHDAYDTFLKSIGLHEALGILDGLWIAQSELAAVEIKRQQTESAITHYEQALDNIEALRAGLREKEHKIAFMKDKLYVYDDLIDLLQALHQTSQQKGYDRKALEIFERRQGRLFLEEMGKSGARLFAGLPDEIKQQEDELDIRIEQIRQQLADERAKSEPAHRRIQRLERQQQKLQVEQLELTDTIKRGYPDYYALRYPQPVDLTELQTQIVQPAEIMFVYHVMQNKTLLWAIGTELFRLYTLPVGEHALQESIMALREALWDEWGTYRAGSKRGLNIANGAAEKAKSARSSKTSSYELFTQLFPEEIRGLLTEPYSLHIIPTGPLYALSFESLVTSLPEHENAMPRYLIEQLPMSYLSSASLLKTLRESQQRKKAIAPSPVLAFADPVYSLEPAEEPGKIRSIRSQTYREMLGVGGISELPDTAEEAETIAQLFDAPQETNPLQLRWDASRTNVLAFNTEKRLAEYRYLLFAMHGLMPGEVDYLNQSALILSDDFLTMADVFSLELNAKLVALSACNTGRGQQVRGEGIMGLTRAFMYAGTPAIAVTLWSVESVSAKTLSIGMFRYLKEGSSPAQALRNIKIRMLRGKAGEEYCHPYYWAPYVVFGDGL